jgi:hypothetical protein
MSLYSTITPVESENAIIYTLQSTWTLRFEGINYWGDKFKRINGLHHT